MKNKAVQFVLDSFALLAYFEDEPGGSRVRGILAQAVQDDSTAVSLSVINFGEVVYISEREQGLPAAQRVIAAIDQLPIFLVDADRALTLSAAHVKAQHSISYADAFAIALAQQSKGILLTGDPEFRKVEHLASIEWLPQRPQASNEGDEIPDA